ncbi:glycerol-3-phosphate acyltransferase 1 [Senna tora]|uniref:Glycerol-3-phosphate acyltransferase 1 n=1 Tax=Senna tora TaxID=362788 RepID=A0A834T5M9_9FABA|nr:glycerol-3-phosphate acyltransferase 1 [Senna tora]
MVLLMVLLRLLATSCHSAARKMGSYGFHLSNFISFKPSHSPSLSPSFPSITKCGLEGRKSQTLACDIHRVLLRSHSFFPFFMLVAFEGGSIIRAFLLLLSCPILWVLDYGLKIRVMTFITFCGLRVRDMESVARAVLPKFYMEDLNLEACEVLGSVGWRVVVTSVPRVMVEGFLKEYLGVEEVVGTELQKFGGYFSGLVSGSCGVVVKHKALKEWFGDGKPDVGLGCGHCVNDLVFISHCKEAYVVKNECSVMPREKYPKPLIFHDGRLAFLPTPSATLFMFMWLPIGIPLALYRILLGILLPHKLALALGSLSGVHINFKTHNPQTPPQTKGSRRGVLYVCTHRTLLDPVFLSTCLAKPLTAVTYSLSRFSEIIAPIRTVRLTRDRNKDGEAMEILLKEGDLVVCPEGTTCREPYLLRFSSLFAELADEIVPVAINTRVSMFYGTTASGLKCLDPIFFLMNPKPCYYIEILEKVPKNLTCGSGGKSSFEVANYIQRKLGDALGFECTSLTRKDKYLMLAGNEGIVQQKKRKKC